MNEKADRAKAYFADWNASLKTIKHLRWLRNKIAHESGDFEVGQQDVNEIKAFHSNLLSAQDPLSLLRKRTAPHRSSVTRTPAKRAADARAVTPENGDENNAETGTLLGFLVAAAVVIAVILIAYFKSH